MSDIEAAGMGFALAGALWMLGAPGLWDREVFWHETLVAVTEDRGRWRDAWARSAQPVPRGKGGARRRRRAAAKRRRARSLERAYSTVASLEAEVTVQLDQATIAARETEVTARCLVLWGWDP